VAVVRHFHSLLLTPTTRETRVEMKMKTATRKKIVERTILSWYQHPKPRQDPGHRHCHRHRQSLHRLDAVHTLLLWTMQWTNNLRQSVKGQCNRGRIRSERVTMMRLLPLYQPPTVLDRPLNRTDRDLPLHHHRHHRRRRRCK